MMFDQAAGASAGTKLIVGACLLAALRPLPAHAQLDAFIDRLVRPAPPPYP